MYFVIRSGHGMYAIISEGSFLPDNTAINPNCHYHQQTSPPPPPPQD